MSVKNELKKKKTFTQGNGKVRDYMSQSYNEITIC